VRCYAKTVVAKAGFIITINQIVENNGKSCFLIRRLAVDFDIPMFTNIKVAKEFIDALETLHNGTELEIKT